MTSPGTDATTPSGTGGYPDALAAPPAEADLWAAPDFVDALATSPVPVETVAGADPLALSPIGWAGDALAGPVAGADPLLGAAALAGEPPYPNGTADTFTDFAVTTMPEPIVVMPAPPPPVPAPPPDRPPRQPSRRSDRRAHQQPPPRRQPQPRRPERSEWVPGHPRPSSQPAATRPIRTTQPRQPTPPEPPRGWGATYTSPPEQPPFRPGHGTPTGTVPWRGQPDRYRLRHAPDRRRRRKKSSLARFIFFAILAIVFVSTQIGSCVSDLTDDLRDRGSPAAPADPGLAQR